MLKMLKRLLCRILGHKYGITWIEGRVRRERCVRCGRWSYVSNYTTRRK